MQQKPPLTNLHPPLTAYCGPNAKTRLIHKVISDSQKKTMVIMSRSTWSYNYPPRSANDVASCATSLSNSVVVSANVSFVGPSGGAQILNPYKMQRGHERASRTAATMAKALAVFAYS